MEGSHIFSNLFLQKNVRTCPCQDPLVPMGRRKNPKWEETHHHNMDAAVVENVDVVFYGDSITEGWMGTIYGRVKPGSENSSREVFDTLFSTESGGEFDGLALGIAGDTVSRFGILKSMYDV
jgi:hypothetical protein